MLLRIYTVSVILVLMFSSCLSPKEKIQKTIEQMQSTQIYMPYDQMDCWTSDSLLNLPYWKYAKLKLVHYVDSAMCSSCYLQKVVFDEDLFQLESSTNYEFYNVFIVNPTSKAKRKLEEEFANSLIPQTIFIDSTKVFVGSNPNLPPEEIFHTFLLDENNKVILVGNPYLNTNVRSLLLSVIKERLHIKK